MSKDAKVLLILLVTKKINVEKYLNALGKVLNK